MGVDVLLVQPSDPNRRIDDIRKCPRNGNKVVYGTHFFTLPG